MQSWDPKPWMTIPLHLLNHPANGVTSEASALEAKLEREEKRELLRQTEKDWSSDNQLKSKDTDTENWHTVSSWTIGYSQWGKRVLEAAGAQNWENILNCYKQSRNRKLHNKQEIENHLETW